MGKRNKKTKGDARRSQQGGIPVEKQPQSRNRVLLSVAGVIIVAVLAFLFLGSDSTTAPSEAPVVTSDQVSDTAAASEQPVAGDGHGPSIHFPELSYDFGSISQGGKVSHTFVVQNTGDEPLKLIRAQGS